MNTFKQLEGHARWSSEALNACVTINEDYARTYCAYNNVFPYSREVMCNANGNAIRFRSVEAAMRYIVKQRKSTSKRAS